jgi:membrane protease YdiL (CAAX protease family)
MFNRYLTYYSPAMQFVIFCAIMSMSLLLGAYIADLLNERYLGVSSAALESMTEISPALAFKLKILNPVLLIIMLLLPGLLFAYLAYPLPRKYLGLQTSMDPTFLLMCLLLLGASLPIVSALEEWSQKIPFFSNNGIDSYGVLTKSMLKGGQISDLLINIVGICLIPALAEEIFFRGCLQQILLNWLRSYPILAIVIVAVLFSAFHGQLSGFIPRVFLGLLLGLIYYYSGNLWLTILMHFANNLIGVFFSFLKERGIIAFDIMETTSVPILWAIISLVASVGVLYWFYTKRQKFIPIEVEKDDQTNNHINAE